VKKNKKKKSKKQKEAAAKAEQAAAEQAAAEAAAKAAAEAAGSKKKKKKAKAAAAVEPTPVPVRAPEEAGWTTIETKQKAPVVVVTKAVAEGGGVDSVSCTIDLHNHVRSVIGSKGAVIQAIQGSSGANINIDKDSSANTCTIKGTAEEVASAETQIRSIINDYNDRQALLVEEKIPLALAKHKVIIGKGGATIKRIEKESGCRVFIPRDEPEDFITVKGDKEQVDVAKKMIKNEIEGETTFKIPFDQHALGEAGVRSLFLNNRAAKLQELEREHGAKIDIARDSTTIVITGDTQPVLATSMSINKLLASVANSEVIHVDDPKKTGRIIGRGGDMIKLLQQETGCWINVDKETATIKINGSVPQVAAARKRIEDILANDNPTPQLMKGEVSETIQVKKSTAGAIIGKQGATIRELQTNSGAKIAMMDAVDGQVPCMVYGSAASVKKAVAMIQEKLVEAKAQDEERAARRVKDKENMASTQESFGTENFTAPMSPGGDAPEGSGDGWGGSPTDSAGW
jgi:rRNA processing protein Krr1/Pno1